MARAPAHQSGRRGRRRDDGGRARVHRSDHLRGAHRPAGPHQPVRGRTRARSHRAGAGGEGHRRRSGDRGLHGPGGDGPGSGLVGSDFAGSKIARAARPGDERSDVGPRANAPQRRTPARAWVHDPRSGYRRARGRRGQRTGTHAGARSDLRAHWPRPREEVIAGRRERARLRGPDARGARSGSVHLQSQLGQDGGGDRRVGVAARRERDARRRSAGSGAADGNRRRACRIDRRDGCGDFARARDTRRADHGRRARPISARRPSRRKRSNAERRARRCRSTSNRRRTFSARPRASAGREP